MKQNNYTDTSVLVVSCDKYSDMWKPFFTLFRRYWPDNPLKVYLGSNHLVYNDSDVTTLLAGEDKSWSHGLLKMIEQVETPYVILMLEDFFLQETVDTDSVIKCINTLKNLDGHMLRLIPRPGPDKGVADHPFLGYIKPDASFRVSTQGTLWRKSALLSLIREGESAWEFELNSTERSRNQKNGYYCVWKPVLTYKHHVVERGKWFRSEARKFGAMDIGCDFSRRAVMSVYETYMWHVGKLLSFPKNMIPWGFRQKIKERGASFILSEK
ncbi:MAG: hypothetical protein GY795_09910 [Desulfobacterales bacterium]|nr:hypothetical protein [Desulfobacterales bacterium]